MPTIRDVAARAKVSVATVSRVLNQSGYADAATVARVRKAAADLNYQPNANWSRLKSKSSQTVLFLLGNRDTFNAFHMRLLASCERMLQSRGYDLFFSRYEYSGALPSAQLALPRMLAQTGALDGVILAGVHHKNLLDVLDKRQIPYTFLANDYPSPPPNNCVTFNDRAGLDEATEYLIHLGHKRIAYIGNLEQTWFQRRYNGYKDAIERHQLKPQAIGENWLLSGIEYGQRATVQLLATKHRPTAIVCGNDEIAAGAWKELTRRKIAIPQEMSLVGCGDRIEYSILEPELTSISVFVEELGEHLTSMLLTRLANPESAPASQTYPCKLAIRASCQPPLS
jgi:DNA-binding LacI/PurR family transcriptional regulator